MRQIGEKRWYSMAHRIQIARAWCGECLAECFHAYDESTGENTHIGATTADLARKGQELKTQGYQVSHRGGVFTYTLYKDQLFPLEWQFVAESREPEYIQDW